MADQLGIGVLAMCLVAVTSVYMVLALHSNGHQSERHP
jgi:hypothetical protein